MPSGKTGDDTLGDGESLSDRLKEFATDKYTPSMALDEADQSPILSTVANPNSWKVLEAADIETRGEISLCNLPASTSNVIYWKSGEDSEGNVLICGLLWLDRSDPQYFEGTIYPPE